jgi:hypothetical protein
MKKYCDHQNYPSGVFEGLHILSPPPEYEKVVFGMLSVYACMYECNESFASA